MDLVDIAGKFSYDIEKIKSFITDRYYGFIRIKLVDAAIILGKSMGFSCRAGRQIVVPKSLFEPDNLFWNKSQVSDSSYFGYSPHTYPLPQFEAPIPEKTQRILDMVENYPCIGNKPIFDHYWVVCPSISVGYNELNYKWKLSSKGEQQGLLSHELAIPRHLAEIDFYLTTENVFRPIVLGEKDGKCFFLSYWA